VAHSSQDELSPDSAVQENAPNGAASTSATRTKTWTPTPAAKLLLQHIKASKHSITAPSAQVLTGAQKPAGTTQIPSELFANPHVAAEPLSDSFNIINALLNQGPK
jgi:hypothetical protein